MIHLLNDSIIRRRIVFALIFLFFIMIFLTREYCILQYKKTIKIFCARSLTIPLEWIKQNFQEESLYVNVEIESSG
ncbi:MAG: hypothetical protein B6U94_01615 [Thermofilum sp. ex4484_79]|nr:MAG: hypothetical protein B6U94_01615 [Thermofilum sp. ex4484_79]